MSDIVISEIKRDHIVKMERERTDADSQTTGTSRTSPTALNPQTDPRGSNSERQRSSRV